MSSLFALLLFSGSALVPAPQPAPVKIRAYSAPRLDPEPEFVPSETKVVKIFPSNDEADEAVLARPWYPSPMVGHVARGARIAVRGELVTEAARGCPSKKFYALEPFGWICSSLTRPSDEPATTDEVLQVPEGSSLPYTYVMVAVPEGESIPMWSSLAAVRAGQPPERKLERGDTIAVRPTVQKIDGVSYYVAVDDKVTTVKGTFKMTELSQWQGVTIDAQTHLPFAWTRQKAPVYDAPNGKKIDTLERRARVDLFEEQKVAGVRWVSLGEGRWIKGSHVNEVRVLERPKSTLGNRQWFDVDLGEQVVTAYIDDAPVYATLISSGKTPNNTPRGSYPIWGKVAAITMKSQGYDDKAYYVNKVPWVMFFQAHNALHGAYWHDVFGTEKSHGCANLSPKDARYLFEWTEPKLPAGWTSVRYWDLNQAPVAYVHNTSQRRGFVQDRNIGPPRKDDEADRLGQAIARREAKTQEEMARLSALASTGDAAAAEQLAALQASVLAAQAAAAAAGVAPVASGAAAGVAPVASGAAAGVAPVAAGAQPPAAIAGALGPAPVSAGPAVIPNTAQPATRPAALPAPVAPAAPPVAAPPPALPGSTPNPAQR